MNAAENLKAQKYTEFFVETPAIKLCAREYGDPAGIPVLMIMGLGCQITHWPDHLLESLLEAPIRLICFDNRDTGLSENIRSYQRIDTRLAFLSHKVGFHPDANYSLHDMAADTAHLIRSLELGPTHVVGVSMGGMIGQLLAANYSDQIASLSAIMSSTNSPKLPLPELSLMMKFGLTGRPPRNREEQIKRWMGFWRLIQSPNYPTPKEDIEVMVRSGFDRHYSPAGTLRQLQAILATGSLGSTIRSIDVPTQVIHGREDPLLKPECGEAIAKRIKGAQMHLIPGMGHDLPRQLSPQISQLVLDHIKKAEERC